MCNNDLPQSNHDFCTKAAWPRPSQFWGTVATMWGTNSECSIAAKYTWLDPSFVCNNDLPQSNRDFCTSAQRLHGQDGASFGAQWPQCGAQTVSAALPQKARAETPVFVCNNDLPQSNHDFCTKAARPRPSQFWSIVTTMWGTNCQCSIAAKNTW